ncbi:MAG: hypothetical protein II998_00360 [Clostridia bacterium]|nr:hypothetical protein [Clostridia bacterium]
MNFKDYALSHQNTFCLELERVVMLLNMAGNPDRKLKIIHVAGTNGKGSVCSFITEGLIFSGERVGRFSSPELIDITDTITVNSNPVTLSELEEIYTELSPLCDEIFSKTQKRPSQFEINFVAALLYFVKNNCTFAVIECGMGGEGDATNAIVDSLISVITRISLDHESFLGNTLTKITRNKCGIFKSKSHIVTGAQEPEVMNTIKEMAGIRKLTITKPLKSCGFYGFSEIVSFGDEEIKLSLFGVHQAYNAAIAAEVLCILGFDKSVKYALEHAKNPARLERTEEKVYFDGAHNPDGVKQLAESINRYCPKEKKIFVIGFMADKDYKTALDNLKILDNSDFEIYTVKVHSNPRSETAKVLADTCIRLGFKAYAYDNITQAIEAAKKNADIVFAFGSLYMYKEYKKS